MMGTAWKRRGVWGCVGLLLAAGLVWGMVGLLSQRGEDAVVDASPPMSAPDAALVAQGAYLARVGNCMGCHTVRGGTPYAGGRGIDTPFGMVYTSNLTPDSETGIGRWSSDHFWRALHNGRSRDGRLLYPAFPYVEYTRVSREDSDALFAFLRSLPPVQQANRDHALRFPYSSQWALAGWRTLFFRPGVQQPEPAQSAEWNRGAYLVRGLGHCAACHTPRNALGASRASQDLAGSMIPMQNWYAPGLRSQWEAGVAHWSQDEVVTLLRTGLSAQGAVMGPMADVVFNSTQYLTPADAQAMATYLRALPQESRQEPLPGRTPGAEAMRQGGDLYAQHCAQCHGEQGQGRAGAFPALAGSRSVRMEPAVNGIQAVLHGGYAPATTGNPRPFGMPPFGHVLSDAEVAAVLSFVRASWGNQATPVTAMDVYQLR